MALRSDQEQSISINSKTISAVLGLIALMTAVFTGISTVNGYAYRIEKLEADKILLSSSMDKLTQEISSLNAKIVDLTITLNRVQDRTEKVVVK